MNRREILRTGVGVVSAAALPRGAFAQAKFPERPIRLMIPFSPGGVTDIVADGHSILLGNTSVLVLNPMTSAKLSYDPIKDFVPISILCVASVAWVVHASVPAKTLKEFVDYAKANRLSYGSAGTGTMTHLAAEQFKQATGLNDLTHIPYKGAGPAIADLVSGHIPAGTPNVTSQVLEFHKTGKVRILAVLANERLKGAPEIPTAIEAAFPTRWASCSSACSHRRRRHGRLSSRSPPPTKR
jgi:tripartite-type tricarboxylate transporter receptor subunit TctC